MLQPTNFAKNLILVFILAFSLNLIWEFFHSVLYTHYQGATITSLILTRAAIVDAIIISLLFLIAWKLKVNTSLVVILGGLLVAIALETWALQTGRWAYSASMPIIPLLTTGLTPTIQLAITGYLVKKLVGADEHRKTK